MLQQAMPGCLFLYYHTLEQITHCDLARVLAVHIFSRLGRGCLDQVADGLGKLPRLGRLPATRLTWLTYPQLVQILCFPSNQTHS
jgi:hypothetical protein